MNIQAVCPVKSSGYSLNASKKGQGIPSFKAQLHVSAAADDLLRTLLAMDCIKTVKPLDLWKGQIVKYKEIISSVKKGVEHVGGFNRPMTIDVSPEAKKLLKNPRILHDSFEGEKFVLYEGFPGNAKGEKFCLFNFNLDDKTFAEFLEKSVKKLVD